MVPVVDTTCVTLGRFPWIFLEIQGQIDTFVLPKLKVKNGPVPEMANFPSVLYMHTVDIYKDVYLYIFIYIDMIKYYEFMYVYRGPLSKYGNPRGERSKGSKKPPAPVQEVLPELVPGATAWDTESSNLTLA